MADNFRKETEVILMRWEEPTLELAPLGVAARMMETWNELEVIHSVLECYLGLGGVKVGLIRI